MAVMDIVMAVMDVLFVVEFETRIQEGIATLIATLTVMIVPLSLLLCAIFIVVKIFGWIGGILF